MLTRLGLGAKADVLPGNLTQIELRKLELARALAAQPRLVIADEAMAGLSHAEVDEMLTLLLDLNAGGIAILMIEHIMRAVMRFSQRIVVLDAGRKIADGPPADDPARQGGRACLSRRLNSSSTNLSAGYGAVRVLDNVSLTLAPGETVALLGTSGNGKSTLINTIMGLVRPRAGTIYLEEGGKRTALAGNRTEAIADLGLALVPEGRRLFPKLDRQGEFAARRLSPRRRARCATIAWPNVSTRFRC